MPVPPDPAFHWLATIRLSGMGKREAGSFLYPAMRSCGALKAVRAGSPGRPDFHAHAVVPEAGVAALRESVESHPRADWSGPLDDALKPVHDLGGALAYLDRQPKGVVLSLSYARVEGQSEGMESVSKGEAENLSRERERYRLRLRLRGGRSEEAGRPAFG